MVDDSDILVNFDGVSLFTKTPMNDLVELDARPMGKLFPLLISILNPHYLPYKA